MRPGRAIDRGRELSGVVARRASRGRPRRAVPARACTPSRCRSTCPARSSGSSSTTTDRVALRAMTRGDLPDVARWRQPTHVRRWWSPTASPTAETVAAQYGPRHRRDDPDPDVGASRPTAARSASCRTTGSRDYPEYAAARARPGGDRRRLRDRRASCGSAAGSAPGCSGRGCCGPGTASPTRRRTSRRPTTATRPSLRVLDKAGFVRGHLVRRAPGRRHRRHGGRLHARRGARCSG